MASNETKRLSTAAIAADEDAYLGFKAIDGYQPINPDFGQTAIAGLYAGFRAAVEAEVQAQNAFSAARDAAIAAEWKFHNGMLGAKNQILAQFGPDSDQVAAVGLKKKSERKRPTRNNKPNA